MRRIVLLLEERSMKNFLEALLPRLFPTLKFLYIPHSGKSDLEKSIPNKLKGWNVSGDCFVILRDNDNGDCRVIKRKLADLCRKGGREDSLVRLACQELESWFLGDLKALGECYGIALRVGQRQKAYRDPDNLGNPSEQIKKLVPAFQKYEGARRLGMALHPEKNSSRSFRAFIDGVARISGIQPYW